MNECQSRWPPRYSSARQHDPPARQVGLHRERVLESVGLPRRRLIVGRLAQERLPTTEEGVRRSQHLRPIRCRDRRVSRQGREVGGSCPGLDEIGEELPAVRHPPDGSPAQPGGVGVELGLVRWWRGLADHERRPRRREVVRGDSVAGDVGVRSRRRGPVHPQEAQEVEPGFDGETAASRGGAHRLPLHGDLERQVPVVVVGGSLGCVRSGPASVQARDAPAHGLEPGLDRRPCVLAVELAELPLPSQQPQRVGDLRPQTGSEVVGSGERLEPLPGRDRAHGRLLGTAGTGAVGTAEVEAVGREPVMAGPGRRCCRP